MKQVIYEPQREMIEWAASTLTDTSGAEFRFRSDAHAIGLRDELGYRGVVVFDNFSNSGCWVSVVSDGSKRWITREFIIRVFAYPFIQLLYPRINAFVSVNNEESKTFCNHFGWVLEGVMREAGAQGEDLLIFGMLERECRWLPKTFTGKVPKSALYH